ncbi:hypothetical protein Mapa_000363 [Marchantia paleacea]|nr:hypothetical protein Mapa_000363 [Marchantia paleacea]
MQKPSGPVDLSPATTTVAFDPIIPPLRVPVSAGVEDDPSKGKWVLAFRDDSSWRQAWLNSEDKIASQCEMGARMGCSISASNACRIPWWKNVLVFLKAARIEEGERERCEENEMAACVAASKESCSKYARETCEPVFADMRIADPEQSIDPRFMRPFRRKRWTRHMKDNVSPSGESNVGSDEDLESASGLKLSSDYRRRVLADEETTRSQWGGPAWTEALSQSASSSVGESPAEGWEGGLIRPKVDASSTQHGFVRSENVQGTNSTNVENAHRGPYSQTKL